MLHTMSMEQALEIWGELTDAYYGANGYGGDTAELYVYRFMNGSTRDLELLEKPGVMGDLVRENFDKANRAMFTLFSLFAEKREVKIFVEDRELGLWLETARFSHRVHVKVTPKRGR